MAMFEIGVVVLFSFWYEPRTLYISPASMTFLPDSNITYDILYDIVYDIVCDVTIVHI
jgi:hypothetical protein